MWSNTQNSGLIITQNIHGADTKLSGPLSVAVDLYVPQSTVGNVLRLVSTGGTYGLKTIIDTPALDQAFGAAATPDQLQISDAGVSTIFLYKHKQN